MGDERELPKKPYTPPTLRKLDARCVHDVRSLSGALMPLTRIEYVLDCACEGRDGKAEGGSEEREAREARTDGGGVPITWDEAMKQADENGHMLDSDPPRGLSTVRRFTCTGCGRSLLMHEESRNVYGSVVESSRRCGAESAAVLPGNDGGRRCF